MDYVGLSKKKWIYKPHNLKNISKKFKDYWPYNNKKIDFFTKRLLKSYKNNEKIGIIGDYDVDGVSSASLFSIFCKEIGWDHEVIIPNRFTDGYGPSIKLVNRLIQKKCQIVTTLDSGTTAYDVINYLEKKSIPMFIIDHHHIPKPIDNAFFINSKQWEGDDNIEHLCATGLTFVVLVELNNKLNKKVNMNKYFDLVALGTVCDVVPLVGLNRAIVHYGVQKLKDNPMHSLKMLLPADKEVNTDAFGYYIGPHINSAGRLKDGILAYNAITNERNEKHVIELIKTNIMRKKEQNAILDNLKIDNSKNFILAKGNWNQGLIGIVAGRLKEKYDKPVAIFSEYQGILKGSFRAPEPFHIGEFIKKLKDKNIILYGGGHQAAGGCSLEVSKWQDLYDYFDQFTKNFQVKNYIYYNDILNLNNIPDVESLKPFGASNPKPVYLLKGTFQVIKYSPHGATISINSINQSISGFIFKDTLVYQNISIINNRKIYCLCSLSKYNNKHVVKIIDICYVI